LAIATVLLSLCFRKGDRIKVIKTAALFVGLLVSTVLVFLLLGFMIPKSQDLLLRIVGTLAYVILLVFFMQRITNLVDDSKGEKTDPPAKDSSQASNKLGQEKLATRGIAKTDLNPMGWVDVGGKEYEARASLGFISRGDAVEIEGDNGFELQVRKIE